MIRREKMMMNRKITHPKRFYLLFYIALLDAHTNNISRNNYFVSASSAANRRKPPSSQLRFSKSQESSEINDRYVDMHNIDKQYSDENEYIDSNIIEDDDFDIVNKLFFGTSDSGNNSDDENSDMVDSVNGSMNDSDVNDSSDTSENRNNNGNDRIYNTDDIPQDIASFVNEKLNSSESSKILPTPQSPPPPTTTTAADMNNLYNVDDGPIPPLDIIGLDDNSDVEENDNYSKQKLYQQTYKKPAFKNWNSFPSSNNNNKKENKRDIHNHKTTIRNVANSIIHDSTQTVSAVLRGDVAGHVPTNIYGQTIQEEIAECQSYFPDDDYDEYIPESKNSFYLTGEEEEKEDKDSYDIFNNGILKRKLYGGAQYHRLLQCYDRVFLTKPIQQVSEEEVSLLIHGISSSKHDGADLLRTVAILSSQRMDKLASGILSSLAKRVEFVLGRMWDIIEYTMVTRTLGFKFSYGVGYGHHHQNQHGYGHQNKNGSENTTLSMESLESLERDLISFVKQCFDKFVKQKVQFAYRLASGDIDALMRFVNWDLAFSHGNIGGSLTSTPSSSPSSLQSRIISSDDDDYDWDEYGDEDEENDDELGDLVGGVLDRGKDASALPQPKAMIDSETDKLLMQVIKSVQETAPMSYITNTASATSLQFTNAAVNTLVQHVTTRWRLEISRIVTTKFNAFCLVAFHDEFGTFLRKEMDEYLNDHLQEVV